MFTLYYIIAYTIQFLSWYNAETDLIPNMILLKMRSLDSDKMAAELSMQYSGKLRANQQKDTLVFRNA